MGCCILSTCNHLPVTGTAFVYHIIVYTGCVIAEDEQYYEIAISESFYALLWNMTSLLLDKYIKYKWRF